MSYLVVRRAEPPRAVPRPLPVEPVTAAADTAAASDAVLPAYFLSRKLDPRDGQRLLGGLVGISQVVAGGKVVGQESLANVAVNIVGNEHGVGRRRRRRLLLLAGGGGTAAHALLLLELPRDL